MPDTVTDLQLLEKTLQTLAETVISTKREPPCSAYLARDSIRSPLLISAVRFDVASSDCFQERPTILLTLDAEAEDGLKPDKRFSLLSFDVRFLTDFNRAFQLAAMSREEHWVPFGDDSDRSCVEHVTADGNARLRQPTRLLLRPFDSIVLIEGSWGSRKKRRYDALFQLPRTDQFIRKFANMFLFTHKVVDETFFYMRRQQQSRRSISS